MREDYEFTILYDIYEERLDEQGQPQYRVKKRDCKRKWVTTDINNLTDIREVPNRKGIPYKNKCEVFSKYENKWIVIQGKFEDLREKIIPIERNKIIGFR